VDRERDRWSSWSGQGFEIRADAALRLVLS
jgi:hypothetical protein